MKSNIKKIIFFLTAVLMNFVMITGCSGKIENDEPAENNNSGQEVLITDNGKALFTIVRGDNAKDSEVTLVMEFRRQLEKVSGVNFKLETDWVKKNQEPDMTTFEILVGITNRTSDETLSSLGTLDYYIGYNGTKIEIIAKNEYGLKAAIEKFFSDDILSVSDGRVVLHEISVTSTASLSAGEIPDYTSGDIECIYESSGDTVVIKAIGTTAEEYAAYLDILHEVGFDDYASNKIGDSLFTTLTNESTTVNCYYIASTGVTRVIYEPKGALYTRESDNKYEDKDMDTFLTGMEGETVVAMEGMGFIIRLCDGSFIIIDGGMGDPDNVDSDKLMNILLEQSPEGIEKPIIAAWIFTHLHGDHVGVYNCFSIDHHDDVIIEQLIYNFPKEEEIAISDSPYMLDDTIYRYTQFKKSLVEYYPDVPIVKIHTGNKFYIRNAEFEVLSTLEDIVPKTILDGGMNESSLLLKMIIGGQTTLWTGDIAFIATDVALKQFGDYLKSDMFQMAHHGLNGTVEFHKAVDPEYCFLPVWDGGYQSFKEYEQNKWLINSVNMKHMIVTSYGTWTIKLPYSPEDGTYDRLPSSKTIHPKFPQLLGE